MCILCIDYSLFEIKRTVSLFYVSFDKVININKLIIAKEKVQLHVHFEKVVLNIN